MTKTFCHTTLHYVPGAGSPGNANVDVEILDGRRAGLPGWEDCGFELVDHHSALTDWADEAAIATTHYAEIEELARKLTNADHALVSAHIRRSPEAAARHGDLSPITFVHSDFAAGYDEVLRAGYREPRAGMGEALARNGIVPAAVLDAPRIVILQFWRNVGPPKMDFPLAFCDARTVGVDEARPFRVENYAGTGATFDALAVAAPADPRRHGWYTFPGLQQHEAVAFRTYDTDLVREGGTYFTPHSAFRDPEVPVGRPARSSIELRAICLFA